MGNPDHEKENSKASHAKQIAANIIAKANAKIAEEGEGADLSDLAQEIGAMGAEIGAEYLLGSIASVATGVAVSSIGFGLPLSFAVSAAGKAAGMAFGEEYKDESQIVAEAVARALISLAIMGATGGIPADLLAVIAITAGGVAFDIGADLVANEISGKGFSIGDLASKIADSAEHVVSSRIEAHQLSDGLKTDFVAESSEEPTLKNHKSEERQSFASKVIQHRNEHHSEKIVQNFLKN